MSDADQLPAIVATPSPAESIPAMLAAGKPKRARLAQPAPSIVTPAQPPALELAAPVPPAAVPADPLSEERTMATTIENATMTATDKTEAMFADLHGRAGDTMAKTGKIVEDMNVFAKDNVEALVESGKIAMRGLESMAQGVAGSARKHFEDTNAMVRTLAAVKSPTEFLKIQSDFVRAQFDQMVGETSRSTEAMLKLAGEVVQPISNRVAVAVEKMKVAA